MNATNLRFVCLGVSLVGFTAACEFPVEPVARDTDSRSVAGLYQLTQEDLNRIARGLARALESESLRRELVADLRSSPYEQYSLDFNRYISSNSLLPNALRAELADDLIDRLLSSGDQVELLIPDAWHRANWEATDDIVVVGNIDPLVTAGLVDPAVLSRVAYRADGSSFVWEFGEQIHDPYVKVNARHASFVPRPSGGAVAAAANGNRLTVSTLEGGFGLPPWA